jgi:hypothetical protein
MRELLNEMEKLGRKGGAQNPWSGEIGEGMEALEQGQNDKAMEAMERALNKLRSMEERGATGRGCAAGARTSGAGPARESAGSGQREDPVTRVTFPRARGSSPARGKSGNPKGDPTQRLRAQSLRRGRGGPVAAGPQGRHGHQPDGQGGEHALAPPVPRVVGQYRKMMEEAIAREQVPRDYQSQVKQYFQSLDEK